MQHVSPLQVGESAVLLIDIGHVLHTCKLSRLSRPRGRGNGKAPVHHSSRHIDKLGGLSGSGQQSGQDCTNYLELNKSLTIDN